jgi:hypothetical protein
LGTREANWLQSILMEYEGLLVLTPALSSEERENV